MLKVYTAR